jgi:hypothetical protein
MTHVACCIMFFANLPVSSSEYRFKFSDLAVLRIGAAISTQQGEIDSFPYSSPRALKASFDVTSSLLHVISEFFTSFWNISLNTRTLKNRRVRFFSLLRILAFCLFPYCRIRYTIGTVSVLLLSIPFPQLPRVARSPITQSNKGWCTVIFSKGWRANFGCSTIVTEPPYLRVCCLGFDVLDFG